MSFSFRLVLFLLLLVWCSGIYIEWSFPLDEKIAAIVPFLKKTYSLVCHQQKMKLISFSGLETLVCSRCAGIYLGSLLTSLIILFRLPVNNLRIKMLIAAASPMFIDIILSSMKIYHYSKTIAFLTGFLLGSVGFLYLYAGLNQLMKEFKN